jgi:hypothetical protein
MAKLPDPKKELKKAQPLETSPGKPVPQAAPRKPVPLKAAAGPQPAANPKGQTSDPSTDEEEGRGLAGIWHDLTDQAPGWLSSTIFHAVVLVVLGVWILAPEKEPVQHEMTLAPPTEEEKPEDIEVDEPLEEKLELDQEVEITQPVETESLEEQMDVTEFEDEPAPALELDPVEIGIEVLPNVDASSDTGSVMGSGLDGRGAKARKGLVASGGGSPESEVAVGLALEWLANHQNPDGSWNFDHSKGACQGRCSHPGSLIKCTTGATGLALLPFLGAGHTHKEGKYKRNVQAGLYYLVNKMQKDGSLVEGGGLYDHGICSIALCEAYAMTQDRGLMAPAQGALNFIVSSQDKVGGGWRYSPGQPGDTSVVGWQIMALKSGHMGYLVIPPETIQGAENFLNTVQSESGAAYGYTSPGAGHGTTAVGLLCRMYLGWKQDNPALERGVQMISDWNFSRANVYYNYYATQVMHHYGGDLWKKWNEGPGGNNGMRDYYVNTQVKAGHETGSWFFGGGDHGAEKGGRLYITCMCTMTLEVYYRHLPLYRKQAAEAEFDK